MTRSRLEAAARPVNNIYTALAGGACVATLMALLLAYFRWRTLTNGAPLFFNLF